MHENAPVLKGEERSKTGSRYSRRLRTEGKLPAVLYGHGETPQPLSLDAHETLIHIHKGEKVFKLEMGGSDQIVLLRDLQFDYLGNNIVHADFSRVDLNEKIHAHTTIHLIGEAAGLKQAGAVMMHPVNEINIECTVANLPESVDVDVSGLEAHGTIHAKDVELPNGVKLLSDPDEVIAHIVIQGETDTGEAETVEGESSPEIINEKKKEEEG